MSIRLTTSGHDRVEFGDIAAIDGLTAISVAFTFKLKTASNDRRLLGQWGASGGFLCQVQDTNEIGLVVRGPGGQFYGPKTTGVNIAVDGLYRVVVRIWGLGTSRQYDVWVNGSSVSVGTFLDTGDPGTIGNSSEPVFIGYEGSSSADCEDAEYSEYAIWGVKVSDAFAAAYGGSPGQSPLFEPTGGILYCRMTATTGMTDEFGSATPTATGGTDATHPSMTYPGGGTNTVTIRARVVAQTSKAGTASYGSTEV